MKTKSDNAASILIKAFCDGVAPPATPIEEIRFACEQALHDLDDDSRPERDRINSAVRLLACIPFINSRLPPAALNEIYGRQGVVPVE